MKRRDFLNILGATLAGLTATRVTLATDEPIPETVTQPAHALGVKWTDERGNVYRYVKAGPCRLEAHTVCAATNGASPYDGVVAANYYDPGAGRLVGMAVTTIKPHAYGYVLVRGGAYGRFRVDESNRDRLT